MPRGRKGPQGPKKMGAGILGDRGAIDGDYSLRHIAAWAALRGERREAARCIAYIAGRRRL